MPRRRRLLHPLWLVALLPLYMGCRLIPALGLGPLGSLAAAALLAAGCIAVPLSVRRTDRIAWAGLIGLGFFSTLFVVTVLRDLLLAVAWFPLGAAQFTALTTISA